MTAAAAGCVPAAAEVRSWSVATESAPVTLRVAAPATPTALSRWYLRSTLATLVVLWLVVVTGGLVRLTSSGLGCRHWPTCTTTSLVPPDHYHALIEFGNRMISGAALIAAVISALLAWRLPWTAGWVRRMTVAAAAGTFAQIPLGGITVYYDLNPLLVMSHFLLAMAVVVCATWAAFEAHRIARGHDIRGALGSLELHAWLAVAACLALIVSGTFVTAAGPHAGSTTVIVKRFGDYYDAAWVHVRVATAYIVVLAALLWRLRREATRARGLALCTFALTLLQFGVGEYQYRNNLPWEVVAVHVMLAVTVLALTVVLAAEVTTARLRGGRGAAVPAGPRTPA